MVYILFGAPKKMYRVGISKEGKMVNDKNCLQDMQYSFCLQHSHNILTDKRWVICLSLNTSDQQYKASE